MAKLRQNHVRSGKRPFAGLTIRVFLMFGILAIMFVFAFRYFKRSDANSSISLNLDRDAERSSLIPEGNSAEIIEHAYYTIGYDEANEQPDWATYILTAAELKIPNVPRADRFNQDPRVSTKSARHSDYSRSGYSRGHMVPAGDMAFNEQAMQETFYMSNMSPQLSGFNGGIWRELEECTRDWAYRYGELIIAVGPIIKAHSDQIGKSSKVRVPDYFYKIVVDRSRKNGIAFIIPHAISDQHLHNYAVSIDEVEESVGLDFFDEVYNRVEDHMSIERTFNTSLWPVSSKRYQTRINSWNKN